MRVARRLVLSAMLVAGCGGSTDVGDARASSDTGSSDTAPTEPIVEIAVRRLRTGQDVGEFEAARDAFVDALREQPGVQTDREFAAVFDFATSTEPAPPVFIGMTQYESADAFATAGEALGSSSEAGAFFATFEPEAFTALRPLDSSDPVDLAAIASEPGQVLEVAVRDLSVYDEFDAAAYATARDAFLTLLTSQDGVVAEYQWVSVLDPNLVVGMTVYRDAATFAAVGGGIGAAPETAAFLGGYPPRVGYQHRRAMRPAQFGQALEIGFSHESERSGLCPALLGPERP